MFEERKQLCSKWFETWSDTQRKEVIEELLHICKPKQLFFTRDVLNKVSPIYHMDFTRILPRVVCLYIMSFLDPRSLSRCSQVLIIIPKWIQIWLWKFLFIFSRFVGIGKCWPSRISCGCPSVSDSDGILIIYRAPLRTAYGNSFILRISGRFNTFHSTKYDMLKRFWKKCVRGDPYENFSKFFFFSIFSINILNSFDFDEFKKNQ